MEQLIRSLHERRVIVLVASLVLIGLGIWAATTLKMGQDVTELLPSLDERERKALDVLGRSTLFDRLYLELEGDDADAMVEVASELSDRLVEDPRVEAVESRVTPEQELRTAELVFEHRFHLIDDDSGILDDALSTVAIERKLALGKARMLSPMPGVAQRVIHDPLGFADLAGERMRSSLGSSRFRLYEGFAFTPELDRCLLALRTTVRAMRVDDAGALVDDVRREADRTVQNTGVVARVTGAHVIASESARAVKSDVMRAFIAAGIGIILLFLIYFRRPSFLLIGLIPSGAGVLAGFAVTSLVLDRISGIAVGFGSIIVGISVDYSVHFLAERLSRASDEEDQGKVAARSLICIMPSLLTGFGTTAVVFGFYGMSSFPLIRELGLFAGSGVLVGFLTSVLVLPLAPVWGKKPPGHARVRSLLLRPSRTAAVVITVCVLLPAIGLGAFVPKLKMEDDIRKLDYRSAETAAFAEQFENRWLGPQQGRVAIALGSNMQDALELNDEVASILAGASVPHTSASTVLPAAATQERNMASILARDWEAIRETLENEADVLGFAAGTFEPFFEEVERTRKGEMPVLVPRDLVGTPMDHLVSGALVRGQGEAAVLTFMPGSDQPEEVIVSLETLDGVTVTSRIEVMNEVFEAVRAEVLSLITLSLLGIVLVLLLRYRRVRPAALAMTPVLAACAMTAGAFAISGMEVNAIAVLAFTLIVGVGLDYGIFMVDCLEKGPGAAHTASAVLVSGLTTLVSFGVLISCRNPVLRSTGLVVLSGVIASLVAALLLVPALDVILTPRRNR